MDTQVLPTYIKNPALPDSVRRAMIALEMQRGGKLLKDVGAAMGVSKGRAWQLVKLAERIEKAASLHATPIPDTRVCTKCGEQQSISEFYKEVNHPTGFSSECKSCKRLYAASWRDRNRESARAYSKKYETANRDRLNETARVRYAEDKETERAKAREYRERNKVRILERQRQWCHANPDVSAAKLKTQRLKAQTCYVKGLLRAHAGLPNDLITPEIIELKREQILTTRVLRELNQLLKETT